MKEEVLEMDEKLKERLIEEFGLTEEQIGKLVVAGVKEESHMALLNEVEIRDVTGCNLITGKLIASAFTPTPTQITTEVPKTSEIIGEKEKPSAGQVNDYAQKMGIDSSMLSMFMFANMGAGTGMEIDMSTFLPIPTIVQGYNPKIREMSYLVMGQIESRFNVPIVVINADGSVNADMTVKYITSLEEGFEPAIDNVYYDESGEPFEIIRVGVDAQSIYDADPIMTGHALQKNNMGHGRINWSGVPLEVRQVIHYATNQTKELDPNDESKLGWLRDHIKPGISRMLLKGEFPNALTAFNEANRTGTLPTLRVQLSRSPRKREIMPRRQRRPAGIAGGGSDAGSRFPDDQS